MLIENFKQEINRRLDEGGERIEKCLGMITRDEIWQKPNDQLVSIGNLVNHLCGNISQWVLRGLGGEDITRERSKEFEEITGETGVQLAVKLRTVIDKARNVVADLSESDLEKTYTIQGYQETGTAILVHVVEHLSYHVGQITFYVKLIKNIDVGYYEGQDLEQQ